MEQAAAAMATTLKEEGSKEARLEQALADAREAADQKEEAMAVRVAELEGAAQRAADEASTLTASMQAEWESRVATLEAEVASSNESLELARQHGEARAQEQEMEIAKVKQERDTLREELSNMEEEAQTMATTLKEEARAKEEALEAALNQAREEAAAAAAAAGKLNEAEERFAAAEAQVASLTEAVEQARQQGEARAEVLDKEVSEIKQERASLLEQIATFEEKANARVSELEEKANARVLEVEERANARVSEIEERANARVSEMEAEAAEASDKAEARIAAAEAGAASQTATLHEESARELRSQVELVRGLESQVGALEGALVAEKERAAAAVQSARESEKRMEEKLAARLAEANAQMTVAVDGVVRKLQVAAEAEVNAAKEATAAAEARATAAEDKAANAQEDAEAARRALEQTRDAAAEDVASAERSAAMARDAAVDEAMAQVGAMREECTRLSNANAALTAELESGGGERNEGTVPVEEVLEMAAQVWSRVELLGGTRAEGGLADALKALTATTDETVEEAKRGQNAAMAEARNVVKDAEEAKAAAQTIALERDRLQVELADVTRTQSQLQAQVVQTGAELRELRLQRAAGGFGTEVWGQRQVLGCLGLMQTGAQTTSRWATQATRRFITGPPSRDRDMDGLHNV